MTEPALRGLPRTYAPLGRPTVDAVRGRSVRAAADPEHTPVLDAETEEALR
ncbi:hypothetical protein AB0M39_14670 [Streptomyces sp. NPDC051907]|uniref:hypothetical protein n=1 Tax=Streptomyces sp. NPDC051907 TaxID=3155284 RepID=UPI00342AE1ED